MNMFVALNVCLLSALVFVTYASNILVLLPTPFLSHRSWIQPLLHALGTRGHHLTVLSSHLDNTLDSANHTNILIENVEAFDERSFDFLALARGSTIESIINYYELLKFTIKHDTLSIRSNGTKSLINSSAHFDLIIMDFFHAECYLAFIHKFNYPPVIVFASFGFSPFASYLLGNPQTNSYIPFPIASFSDHMNFYERVVNMFGYALSSSLAASLHFPMMNELVRQNFGETTPPLEEIGRHIDLMFANVDFSLDFSRPLVPNIVPVGGMHIMPEGPLLKDLQDFLDGADQGVILFSLGSVVKGSNMAATTLSCFLEAFGQLHQRVLWKWESVIPAGVSTNVRIMKWLPQNGVLAHPNVKLFMTHGGQLSIQEGLYHAVPMIVMPVFGDQPHNAHKVVTKGIGKRLDLLSLSKEGILDAVNSVLYNSSYRDNVQRLSRRFRDQPQGALDRAVYWTEYLLNHSGAPHLRSAAALIPWYQFWSLDILAALVITIVVILFLFVWGFMSVCKALLGILTASKQKVA